MPKTSAVSLAFQRASLRALGAVAPSTVDRLILDRFATPTRERAHGAESIGAPWSVRSGSETLTAYTSGAAPRVLFVHGWEGSAFDFAPLASTFRAAGFGVVAFDHQAHGRSSGSRATLPQMATATLDVAERGWPHRRRGRSFAWCHCGAVCARWRPCREVCRAHRASA